MKTAFERGGFKYEPDHMVYFTGADGQARQMIPWRIWKKVDSALGGYAWRFQAMRFYSPRTPRRSIE